MAMDGFRLGLDWVDNTGTKGENPWEVGRRQGTVQTSGAGGFGRVVSEDFRNAVSSFSCLLLLRLALFNSVDRQLAQWRVVAALGEFRAVPDQELLPRLKWFDGVEVDVQTVLACDKVLLLHSAGWVDVAHPVAAFLVQTIQDVV